MTRSLNAVELAVQKTALDNAKQNALNAVRDGYAKTQGVLINYTDAFFNNPQSVNPTINIFTDSDTQKNKINLERVLVTEALEKWSSKISSIKAESVTLFIADIDQYLDITKTFVDNLSLIVGNLNTINSGLDRSAIDANIITINTGLSALNNAINIVTLAKTALFSAQSNYDLKLAGYSTQAISAQQARVSQARISVNDSHLVSPIDGIVTKASPNIGEFVSMGQSGFTVQSDNGYKIEAYVPEADVAKISIKNKAGVTLDSYGQYVIFPATVFYIDPAETIIEGVSTYKVTLQFDNSDNRIRSGMTANTEILTHEKNNVLVVSSRAVVDDGGKKTVRVVNKDGKTFTSVPVTIGLKGSYGTTEIISGLIDGQKVVTYIK
jgi:RND family efflux transporter MFP subunit